MSESRLRSRTRELREALDRLHEARCAGGDAWYQHRHALIAAVDGARIDVCDAALEDEENL